MTRWHALDPDAALAELASSPQGLAPEEAARRLREHGPNLLARAETDGLLTIAWRQINNPISWVLVASGLLALGLAKWTDAIVVLGTVIANGAIGFIQEWRAGHAVAALSALVPEQALALRGGAPTRVAAPDLVPGDVVRLEAGDKVPADLRLFAVRNLAIDEATLTGESVPVLKRLERVAEDSGPADRLCMAFGGTIVTTGTATGVVVATGARTEIGQISALLARTDPLETPITRQLAQLSRWIAAGVAAVGVALFGYGTLGRGAPAGESLFLALTLAVAAIPEGLPAIITIALAIGVSRMAARRAVVRQLPAVETLGSTTVICSDKTGTLTRNEMTVQALWVDGREYRLTGVGYDPTGRLERDGKLLASAPEEVVALLECAVLCSDATVARGEDGWTITGDPTEAALVVAAKKAGLDPEALHARHARLDVLPFASETKLMATLDRGGDERFVHVKGGVEQVVERCALEPDAAERVREAVEALAVQGLRVLALARRRAAADETQLGTGSPAALQLLGLAGMIDPPRTEAIDAVRACRAAGITVKMITGDHPTTATAIARVLGILGPGDEAVPGTAIEKADDAGLRDLVARSNAFARVAPAHKLRLVEALQALGHVVAMTGDGVNDAPALKRADIGVAMGITGTAAAKESAKIVLTDDNFASIAAAVEEGRRVYDNLVKALAFVLPVNLGIALILVASVFFFPTVLLTDGEKELLRPMSPTQILWINLVASVALSLPLAFEVLEPQGMKRKPRHRDAPIFSALIVRRTIVVAVLMALGACALFLFEYFRMLGGADPTPARHARALAEAQTECVTSVAFFQTYYALSCRSLDEPVRRIGWLTNPAMFLGILAVVVLQTAFVYVPVFQTLFGSAALDGRSWFESAAAGAIVMPAVVVEKRLLRRRNRAGANLA